MQGYVTNIERETLGNTDYRKVLYTGKHEQLVVMSLKPGEDIGEEVHDVDQFIRIEKGDGTVTMNGKSSPIHAEFAFVIPAGTEHNVTNGPNGEMKLYTLYSPPHHPDGTVHKTKAEAEAAEKEHAGAHR